MPVYHPLTFPAVLSTLSENIKTPYNHTFIKRMNKQKLYNIALPLSQRTFLDFV